MLRGPNRHMLLEGTFPSARSGIGVFVINTKRQNLDLASDMLNVFRHHTL